MRNASYLALATALAPTLALADAHTMAEQPMTYGQRPFYLIDQMEDGALKEELTACMGQAPARTAFSIGHRGAPLMFPEHTRESNVAAARMGAGILECDVTFTQDHVLVCRHAQNDLATTTDILVSDLADTCTVPFTPASGDADAAAECRASDITAAQFETLTPKMDSFDAKATTPEEALGGVASWRTTEYAGDTELLTHAESIALFDALGADFTPELKSASVEMPHDGFSQEDYAQKMIDEYKDAGIDPSRVWAQSFDLSDIKDWIENEPEFGAQAVYLDDRYEAEDDDEGLIDPMDASTFKPTMQELADMGVRYVAPPLWMLITTDDAGAIVPSVYAEEAKAAGLNIIAWSFERSGPAGIRRRLVLPVGVGRGRQRRGLLRGAGRAGPGRRRGRRLLRLAGDGDVLRELQGPLSPPGAPLGAPIRPASEGPAPREAERDPEAPPGAGAAPGHRRRTGEPFAFLAVFGHLLRGMRVDLHVRPPVRCFQSQATPPAPDCSPPAAQVAFHRCKPRSPGTTWPSSPPWRGSARWRGRPRPRAARRRRCRGG